MTPQTQKKLALVAGAAGGMGGATVARLARDGFRIAAFDLNPQVRGVRARPR